MEANINLNNCKGVLSRAASNKNLGGLSVAKSAKQKLTKRRTTKNRQNAVEIKTISFVESELQKENQPRSPSFNNRETECLNNNRNGELSRTQNLSLPRYCQKNDGKDLRGYKSGIQRNSSRSILNFKSNEILKIIKANNERNISM